MNNSKFSNYVKKMNEARASDVNIPSKLGVIGDKIKKTLFKNVPDSQIKAEENIVTKLVHNFNLSIDVKSNASKLLNAIRNGQEEGLDPAEQSVLHIARSMLSSKEHLTNYKPTGVTRGEIEEFASKISNKNQLATGGLKEKESPENVALVLGQFASSLGMTLLLDPTFQKQVILHHEQNYKDEKRKRKESRKGGEYIGKMLKSKFSQATSDEIVKSLTEIAEDLMLANNGEEANELYQFIRGLR